ncbi:MAG: acyl-CoA thioester hydrolase YciA, partial [Clostridium sp.]|nr:acyl-CoA thioester hydrolase YciA [Clostridium sp.]
QIRFLKPVPVGAFVDVAGEVIKVGNTSLQIKICVVMDSQEEAEGVLAADALFVYVALDAEGKPGKVGNTSVLGGSCPDSGI